MSVARARVLSHRSATMLRGATVASNNVMIPGRYLVFGLFGALAASEPTAYLWPFRQPT